jgi:hypothetical protein
MADRLGAKKYPTFLGNYCGPFFVRVLFGACLITMVAMSYRPDSALIPY